MEVTALPPELQILISDVHRFLTEVLSQEVLSEDSEDKRDDLSTRLSQFLQTSPKSKTMPRLHTSVNSDPIMRVKTLSVPGSSPELPRAPPPGQVKKVCPKDLSGTSLFEGTIEKLGGKNQEKWQKRYCVLTPTHLYFFENHKSKKQNNQIYIPAFNATPVKEKGDDKHFSFRLSSSRDSKSYYFRVNDRETFTQWMQNLTQLYAGHDSLGVSGIATRAETMVFNQDDVISTASSSDDGGPNALDTIREDSPPPIPPPTSLLPKSPQQIRKISGPPNPPTLPPPVLTQPPPVLTHPPVSLTVPDTPTQAVPDSTPPLILKTTLDKPPPPPTRRSTALTDGPGVSVKQLRNLKLSQSSISSLPEDVNDSTGVEVDTDKVYETTEEEDFPYDKIYVGKWDFRGEEGDELTFKRGELLLVADPDESSNWWIGDLLDTHTLKACERSGLFYSAFVEPAFAKV